MSVVVGDCVEVMAGMEPDTVDAIVTDPPYDLTGQPTPLALGANPTRTGMRPMGKVSAQRGGFMSKAWDGTGVAFRVETWAQCLRVAKPGAYLLAFGGTRTVHRMTCALEDAGWVVRDMLVWAYASGFPKSRASLKPAWEPIVLCRKPGASRDLNIDAARLPVADDEPNVRITTPSSAKPGMFGVSGHNGQNLIGRWPANVILTSPVFDGGWDGVVGGGETTTGSGERRPNGRPGLRGNWIPTHGSFDGDTGTYSRFFMVREPTRQGEASADRRYDDRGGTDFAPLPGQRRQPVESGSRFFLIPKAPTSERVLSDGRRSPHPTQKPEALIRHLVRLVTPDGGLVLDPFLGSGTLGVVCDGLGIRWLGIEREPEYAQWAEDRIADGRPRWETPP